MTYYLVKKKWSQNGGEDNHVQLKHQAKEGTFCKNTTKTTFRVLSKVPLPWTNGYWNTKLKKERSTKTQLKLLLESWVKFLSLESRQCTVLAPCFLARQRTSWRRQICAWQCSHDSSLVSKCETWNDGCLYTCCNSDNSSTTRIGLYTFPCSKTCKES